jgi:hypothetical protein
MKNFVAPSLLAALVALPAPAAPPSPPAGASRTYVIPHVLESPGRVDQLPDTYDTYVFVTDARGLPADAAGRKQSDPDTLRLYLHDPSGKPTVSATGVEVCNPCTYVLDPQAARRTTISVEDAVLATGGFAVNPGLPPGEPVIDTFAVVVVSGDEPEKLVLDVRTEASGATAQRSKRCPECPMGHVTLIK